MLIGFIVVIIMVLVIVGLMAVGNSSRNDSSIYSAQVKKIKVFINNIEAESVMYYGMNDSYKGFNSNYLASVGIGQELYTDSDADVLGGTMTKDTWDNLPDDFDCDGTDEATDVDFLGKGQGVFLFRGYEPGNQKVIIVYSCKDDDGEYSEIKFVNSQAKTYNPKFDELLEDELNNQDTYYGS